MSLSYHLAAKDSHAHLFALTLNIPNPNPLGQVLSLPNWIAGSYLIRDFCKNVVSIRASGAGENLSVKKLDKHHWIVQPHEGEITLEYEVYAFDLSVRSAYLDGDRAFFNGSSVFLLPLGLEQESCRLTIEKPNEYWQIATGLKALSALEFEAEDYQALIDYPVEIANLCTAEFELKGIQHSLALSGTHQADTSRLERDLSKICQHHLDFFSEAPFDEYHFLTLVRTQGYGGLEHRNSCSLICSRKDLPVVGESGVRQDYAKFLALCSHEYFHAWWVKTIKPSSFHQLDFSRENYTEQLWIYEGFTSYYDELSLLRTKLISPEVYLDLLAQTMTRVQKSRGRHLQSLAESSYDAWTRFYQQDENAPNAIVSYYTKGALLALVLDIEIRRRTKDQNTLDDILQYIWQHYQQQGTENSTVQQVVEQLTKTDFSEFFADYLYDTKELPLTQVLSYVGVECKFSHKKSDLSNFGIHSKEQAGQIIITQVLHQSCAHHSGLYVGDKIITANQVALKQQQFIELVDTLEPGQVLTLGVLRDKVLREIRVEFFSSEPTYCQLSIASDMDADTQQRQQQWFYNA